MASRKRKKTAAAPPPPVRSKPPRAAAPSGPSRAERQRTAVRRDALRRRLIAGGLATVAIVAVVGYVVVDRRASAELRETLTAGSCDVDQRTDPTAAAGQNHVAAPTFAVDPPAGGNHLAGAARGGVYDGTAVPDDGLLVHSLEHGYVVLWHQSDLPDEQREQLAAVEAANRGDVIVAERPSLPVPVAATAWGQRLLCGQSETVALERFVDAYVGKGPENVPRG